MSAKFDNDMSTFLVGNSDQNLLLLQSLLECIHSYSSSYSNWTSSWLDWKKLFVKLHTDTFMSDKFDNDMSTFFVNIPDEKYSVSESTSLNTLLRKPPLHLKKFLVRLKNTFRETAIRDFYERKIWQRNESFLRRQPRSKILLVLGPIKLHTLPL